MPQRGPDEMSEEELRRNFYHVGSEFFSWNAGKNTPNILLQLAGQVQSLQMRMKDAADIFASLRDTVQSASESSTKLAAALNNFTRALVIVGVVGLITQAVYVGFTVWVHFHH
jgi:hypothetical protein